MQYVIKDTANGYDYYFQKNHSKVIIFDDIQEAKKFISDFYNYAFMQAQPMAIFGDGSIVDDVNKHRSMTKVIEKPSDLNRETINYRDMMRY
jgi:hypothetical protein